MARATYLVSVDWNNDGVYTGTGENVSARVRRLEFWRGRDFASQLGASSSAGWLKMELENKSNDYSSFNTASPLNGNLLPGRKVRVQADGTTIWLGYLKRLTPVPNYKGDKIALLEATGPLGVIAQRKVSSAVGGSGTTGAAISGLLDYMGWPAANYIIDAGKTTLTKYWATDQNGLDALYEVENAELGFLWEAADGRIAFSNRHARYVNTAPTTPNKRTLTSQATFSDAAGATLSYNAIELQDPLERVFNIAQSEVRLFTVGALAVLWTLSETGASSPALLQGATKTYWAQYPVMGSAEDVMGVDAWTTPVATTDYTANSAADGSGSSETGNLTIVVTKFATTMQIQITKSGGGGTAYLTKLQARGTPLTLTANPIRVLEENTDSSTLYGDRTWPMPDRWNPTTQDALDWTRFLLSLYRNPPRILTMTYIANKSASHITEMLTRELNDRITVVANNNTGLGINEDFWIENQHHTIASNGLHTVKYQLSQALPANALVWILGSSLLGTGTRLAF